MQVKATSIFLYDLYLLGYYEINLTELFCQTLYEYVIKTIDWYPDAIMSLFDVTYDEGQINMKISAEVFSKAYELAQKLSVGAIGCGPLFDDVPFEIANEIGEFTVGFSTYLIDKMEFLSNNTINGIYGMIKQ